MSPYVTIVNSVNGHQPASARPLAAAPMSSLKNCDSAISSALGTALGTNACHGHAIACTMRVTSCGSASSVVLQRNARSVNVTSSAAVASAATLKPSAATCDQRMSCHFAKRAVLVRPARQSNVLASSGDARVRRRNTASARAPGFSGAIKSCRPRSTVTRPGTSSKLTTSNSVGMTTSSAIKRTTLTGCEPSY